MHPMVIAKCPIFLLFGFFEIIKGAAITVPKNTLVNCKIVNEFNSAPKKISHYLTFFLKENTVYFIVKS